MCYSLDAVDPLLLLLSGGSGDTVECMIALNHASVRLGLTCLDNLILVVWYEELEAVLRSTNMIIEKVIEPQE